jgi:phosphopantetheinyl transferase
MVLLGIGCEHASAETLSHAGKQCVRAAVRELHPDDFSGDIEYGDEGAPVWRETGNGHPTFISISHTSNVAVGIASTRPVGVDIERTDRDVSRIVRGLLPEERELLPRWSAIEILCAKESAGKAQGVGLAGSLQRWVVFEREGQLTVLDALSVTASRSQESQIRDTWAIEIVHQEFRNNSYICAIASPNFGS